MILGGLRSGVLNDIIQGFAMIVFTPAAFAIAKKAALSPSTAVRSFSGHFSRPGMGATMGPGIWAGTCSSGFRGPDVSPVSFQRFMVARDEEALNGTIVLYPLQPPRSSSHGFHRRHGQGRFSRSARQKHGPGSSLLLGAFASPSSAHSSSPVGSRPSCPPWILLSLHRRPWYSPISSVWKRGSPWRSITVLALARWPSSP
ncbi:MAG: hypothetical protein MZU95_07435 [Desulfomicrobium escambiense]|nr:hypothetical protein [Desulfomicrobium escambiense]